jgi:hypothetical protein
VVFRHQRYQRLDPCWTILLRTENINISFFLLSRPLDLLFSALLHLRGEAHGAVVEGVAFELVEGVNAEDAVDVV